MADPKEFQNQNEEKGKGSGEDEVKKDIDEIMGKLTEKPGQEGPEKEPEKKTEQPLNPGKTPESEEEPEDLESILEKISEKTEEEPVEELNAVQRVTGVFFQPQKVFLHLRSKPDWILPVIIAIIFSILASVLVFDIAIDDQVKRIEQNEKIPDEQKERIIDSMEASREGGRRYLNSFVMTPIGVVLVFVLVSLLFWFIGNVLLGGKARYKQLFSAYAYAYLIPAILGSIIKIPLIMSRQTTRVQTSLAAFLSEDASGTALYRILSSFDIFTLWFLVVFGIGFAAMYRFSQNKGIITVFTTWLLLWVLLIRVALGSMFGGILG